MPERFSSLFRIALVLLGILSAAEFEYFLQIFGPTVALRFSTTPYVLIIPLWLAKELNKKQISIKLWLLLSEFCWELLSLTLSYYLLFFWIFQVLGTSLLSLLFGAAVSIAMAMLIMAAVWYAYHVQYRTVIDYYKSRKWFISRFIFLLMAITFIFSVFSVVLG